MKHRDIEERNWVEAYVLGRLSAEEEIQFEEHYAECPQCLEQLELAEDLKHGLRQLASEEARATLGAGVLAAVAQRLSRHPLWLTALLAVLVAPVAWLVFDNRRLAEQIQRAQAQVEQTQQQLELEASTVRDLTVAASRLQQPLADVPTFLLDLVRESTQDAPLAFSVETDEPWLSLAVEIESEVEELTATLKTAEGREVWRKSQLAPNLWGVLILTFPRDLLSSGEYRLELQSKGRDGQLGPIASYPFRVAAASE